MGYKNNIQRNIVHVFDKKLKPTKKKYSVVFFRVELIMILPKGIWCPCPLLACVVKRRDLNSVTLIPTKVHGCMCAMYALDQPHVNGNKLEIDM